MTENGNLKRREHRDLPAADIDALQRLYKLKGLIELAIRPKPL